MNKHSSKEITVEKLNEDLQSPKSCKRNIGQDEVVDRL